MALFVRASFVFAAAVLPVSAEQWYVETTYNDSTCATQTERMAFTMDTFMSMTGASDGCRTEGESSMKFVCENGELKMSVYTGAGCSGTATSTTPFGGACEAKEDEGGSVYRKLSCGALPSGLVGINYVSYAGANCSGEETTMRMAVETGVCTAKEGGTYEKVNIDSTGFTSEVFAASGCTGTPTSSTTMQCDTCINGDAKIACAGLGSASQAAAVVPFMAATLALTSSIAFFV